MKIIVRLIIAITALSLLCGLSVAEEEQDKADRWYPYDIKLSDSYLDASYKITDGFSEQLCNRRTKYVRVLPENYYLYDLPISEISFMDKNEGKWLMLMTSSVPQTETNVGKIYELYLALLDKNGAAIEISPIMTHATFDGTEEYSAFDSAERFVEEILSAEYGSEYMAEFLNCKLEINVWDDVQVLLTFDNYLVE